MDTVYKTFRAEVLGVNADEGSIDLLIPVSTASVDRDGEIVEPTAFKKTLPKFMKRPVLVSSHDYRDLTSQIGEWTKLKITDSGVEGKPKYYINDGNEQADWGFKLASRGMAAFSIGFIPKEWVDGDGVKEPRRTYKEVELLEISQVIVPSNREAIQSIRSKGIDPVANKLMDDVLGDKEIIPEIGIIVPNLVTKPEETDEFIRIPVDTGNHEGHRIRTITISDSEGIKAIYCGTDKVVMTYLFAKDHDWTMAKARAWIKEHAKKYLIAETTTTVNDDISIAVFKVPDTPQIYKIDKITQEEIIDEADYLSTLITTEGISEKASVTMWILVEQIMRLAGDDIPVDIKALVKPDISKVVETKEIFTNQDILESIKRIGG